MSSVEATAGRTSRPVMIEMSSTARTLVGSAIATSSVSSSTNATGIALVALGRLARDQVDGAEIDLERVEVEVVEAEALGRGAGELVGADHACRLQQHVLGRHAVGAGLGDRLVDALLARVAELHEVIGDEAPGAAATARRRQPRPVATRATARRASRGGPSEPWVEKPSAVGSPARQRSAQPAHRARRRPARSAARRSPAGPAGSPAPRYQGRLGPASGWDVCQFVPSVAPLLIAPSGACIPVQRRKLAAPWWTRTSIPSAQRRPRA